MPVESEEIHTAVIEPVIYLLRGRSDLGAVNKAYRDALDEIRDEKPDDAITDAGTALHETLTALGCDGKALGDLIKSAKKRGLLGRHDEVMTSAIEKICTWAAVERNEGEAHRVSRDVLCIETAGAMCIKIPLRILLHGVRQA